MNATQWDAARADAEAALRELDAAEALSADDYDRTRENAYLDALPAARAALAALLAASGDVSGHLTAAGAEHFPSAYPPTGVYTGELPAIYVPEQFLPGTLAHVPHLP